MNKDPYATHLPVLESLLRNENIRAVLEDGGGKYSTKLFLDHGLSLTTVEEDDGWRETIFNMFVDGAKNWDVTDLWHTGLLDPKPDLVFIDGQTGTRAFRANDAFRARVPFVVCHDTEYMDYYNWHALEPEGYTVEHHVAPTGKRTTVFRYGEKPRVIASMATLPERWEYLGAVLYYILMDVDMLYIYVDGDKPLPERIANRPNVTQMTEGPGYGDNGKFLFTQYVSGPVYAAILDDDLYYPRDYVSRLRHYVDKLERRAIVGTAGAVLKSPCASYHRDGKYRRHHFASPVKHLTPVNLLNTGQIMYYTGEVDVPYEAFGEKNMTDIWLARWSQDNGVPMAVIPRPHDWIRHAPIDPSRTIYADRVNNDASETTVVNSRQWKLHALPCSPTQHPTTPPTDTNASK